MGSGKGSQTVRKRAYVPWMFVKPRAQALWALDRGINLMPGYDIWSREIRLWWSSPKRERLRCGAKCRDGTSCNAPPVWGKRLNRPVNGRCRMHGGLSTGPKTEEGRRRITESNRFRSSARYAPGSSEKRGNSESVTQQGDAL